MKGMDVYELRAKLRKLENDIARGEHGEVEEDEAKETEVFVCVTPVTSTGLRLSPAHDGDLRITGVCVIPAWDGSDDEDDTPTSRRIVIEVDVPAEEDKQEGDGSDGSMEWKGEVAGSALPSRHNDDMPFWGRNFILRLEQARIVPEGTKRVTIHAAADEFVEMTVESIVHTGEITRAAMNDLDGVYALFLRSE